MTEPGVIIQAKARINELLREAATKEGVSISRILWLAAFGNPPLKYNLEVQSTSSAMSANDFELAHFVWLDHNTYMTEQVRKKVESVIERLKEYE